MKLHFTPAETYDAFMPQSYAGMGGIGELSPENKQLATMASTGVATTVGILAGLKVVIGGVAMAGPVGAAIAGIATLGLALANLFAQGCGQSCILATRIANEAEPLLAQNLNNYLNAPVHYRSMQQAALNNFDFTWAALVKACSNPALQAAGQRCISDRARGACVWHSTNEPKWIQAGGRWEVQEAGPATDNGPCWNWFSNYRDLIANDPTVVPDPTAADEITSAFSGLTGGSSLMPLAVLAGAGLIAYMVID